MAFTDNSGMYMPVAPAGYGTNGNCFGGDGAWWLIVLFLFAFNGNGWGNGGINNGVNADLQRGFDQQSVMNGVTNLNSNVQNGFSSVNSALCNGFAGVNANINNGFANAENSNNARQIANMQQQFNSQTAITAGLNGIQGQLAQCCCDNRLATANLNSTILSENCMDREALTNGITQLLINNNANTQRIVDTTNSGIQGIHDKLCQLEMDNIKQNYENRILGLQNQLDAARLESQTLQSNAARTAQTAQILANNEAQTTAIEQYIAPNPRPAYIVQNPNCCNSAYVGGCCGN